MSQTFFKILERARLWHVYHVTKAFQAVCSSIVVVGALIYCSLLPSVCDLKTTQMKVQWSLIQELMFYEFGLDHNTVEATINVCGAEDEGTVAYYTVTKWVKKFGSGCKYLDEQTRSGRPKTAFLGCAPSHRSK